LPDDGDYTPILDVLMNGDYFVTSGEVLVPSHRYEGSGTDMTLVADLIWTFPLEFLEVVTGDGESVTTVEVSAAAVGAMGRRTFAIPFDATGQKWVRFAAWDVAGNGALTMPVRLPAP
jgi:hypothetical protein